MAVTSKRAASDATAAGSMNSVMTTRMLIGFTGMRSVQSGFRIGSTQLCIPHLRTVLSSMVRKMTFSTRSPITITVNRPAKTFGISS